MMAMVQQENVGTAQGTDNTNVDMSSVPPAPRLPRNAQYGVGAQSSVTLNSFPTSNASAGYCLHHVDWAPVFGSVYEDEAGHEEDDGRGTTRGHRGSAPSETECYNVGRATRSSSSSKVALVASNRQQDRKKDRGCEYSAFHSPRITIFDSPTTAPHTYIPRCGKTV